MEKGTVKARVLGWKAKKEPGAKKRDKKSKNIERAPRRRAAGSFLRVLRLLLACGLGVTAVLAIFALILSRVVPEHFVTLGIILILAWTGVITISALRKVEKARTAVIFALASVVLMAGHLVIFAYGNSTAGFLRQIDTTAQEVRATTPVDEVLTTPFVLYIAGHDASGARTDVNQLMMVNPRTHRVLLVNTPRDYYVQLAGTTGLREKLTHVGIYGLNKSVETLEDFYGIDINYYMQIDFESLTRLVDVLGGIEVDSAYAFDGFSVGTNHLNGAQALKFARNRKAFGGGDRTRGENQQRVITGIIRKLSNPGTLANYPAILSAMEGSFTTNFGSDNIVKFAKNQIADNPNWDVQAYAVDGEGMLLGTYTFPDEKHYVMLPNYDTVAAAKQKIADLLGE